MSSRVIPCSFGTAALVFVAVALWLPAEVASRHQAEPEPEPATSDTRLIASECAFFATFRPGDFMGDELVRTMIQDIPKSIEQELHVSVNDMARLTLAVLRQGPVQIVRTKKPYDADKLREALTQSGFGSRPRVIEKGKDGPEDAPRKPALLEKKAGGKKIYYTGDLGRWTQGWCPIDKNTFMVGNALAIDALLTTKGKPSSEMTAALGLASRHSLVMAFDGKRLRTLSKQQREDTEREQREWQKKREQRFEEKPRNFPDKEKGGLSRERKASYGEVFVSAQVRAEADDKPKDSGDDLDDLFDTRRGGIALLPFKPLVNAKFGLLTLDIGKSHTLKAKLDFATKEEMDDGETALKSVLYVGRQLAVMLPRLENDFAGMKPLSIPVRTAFEHARVERKDNTLGTTITLKLETGIVKKVRDGIEDARKKQEKMYEKRFEGKAEPKSVKE